MSEINDIKEILGDTFTITLELTQKHQRSEPSLMAKYKNCTYYEGSFLRGSIENLNNQSSKVTYYIGTICMSLIQ